VLPLREQLFVRLAIFSGMRPGEIIGLQWKHVLERYAAPPAFGAGPPGQPRKAAAAILRLRASPESR
jgi:integrase